MKHAAQGAATERGSNERLTIGLSNAAATGDTSNV